MRSEKKKKKQELVESIELKNLPALTHNRIKELAKKYPEAAAELQKRRDDKFVRDAKQEAFSHTFDYFKLKKLKEELKPKEERGSKIERFYNKMDKIGKELEKHSEKAGKFCDNFTEGAVGKQRRNN